MIALIVYITVTGGPKTTEYAERFVTTFMQHPPQHPFRMIVVGNGGPPAWEVGSLFAGLNPQFWQRPNDGADIGAYCEIARTFNSNFNDVAMVCLGESVYFHRAGWLARIVEAWEQNGAGMYGFFASNLVRQHLNTTAFVIGNQLLSTWNEPLNSRLDRYAFEHGPRPMWERVRSLGKPVGLINWSGVYAPFEWRGHQNGFWSGDQTDCLLWCSHTERFAKAEPETKRRWKTNADRGLR